ncbi:MAG: hypothetical protein GY711_16410 [bacterium]|nr:hypothetical protein [bacterium]
MLTASCAGVNLRRFDERPDALDASFQVQFDDFEHLAKSKAELQKLHSALRISFVDHRGLV